MTKEKKTEEIFWKAEFEYVTKSNMSSILASFPIVTTADWKLYFGESGKNAFSSFTFLYQTAAHPTTRIPNSSVRPSVTKKPGYNISGTESRIIKPLVAKRPGKKSEIKNPRKREKNDKK